MFDRSWVEPGAKAAIVRDSRGMRHASVRFVTIDRVLKRDVVVTDDKHYESRFRLHDLTEYGQRDAWSSPARLVPADAPEVKDIIADRRMQSLKYKVEKHVQNWIRKGDDEEARAALSLLEHHLGETG